MRLELINQSSIPIPRQFLHWWVAEFSKWLKRKKIRGWQNPGELCIAFLPKKEAKRVNKSFRGKDYATDVLSFSSMEPSSLGELLICPEVIKKQAKENGLSQRDELGYMVLHGILHLMGYDHEKNEKEAKKMFAIQDEAFDCLRRKWRQKG